MSDKKDFDEAKANLAFEYYKQQREEMMDWGHQTISISLQVIAILITLVAAYFELGKADYNITQPVLQIIRAALSIFLAVLGAVALILNMNIEKTRVGHMERARAARKGAVVLEEFASASDKFGTTHIYYYSICILATITGVLLFVLAFIL